MQTLSEDDIRAKVEQKTGRLSEPIWRLLCKDRYVEEVQDGGYAGAEAELVRRARELRAVFGDQTIPVDAEKKRDGSAYVSRTFAVSALLATDARDREDVQQFRREVLGGRLLSAEEVEGWIEVNSQEPEAKDWFKKKAQAVKRQYRRLEAARKAGRSYSIEGHAELLAYYKPGAKWTQTRPIARVGKLWRLKRLVSALVKDYPWEEAKAVGFALTDGCPLITATATNHFGSFPKVTLNFPAWYSEEDVVRLYWHARKHSFCAKMPAISRRTSRLIEFVCEKKESWESWEACWKQWNEDPDTPLEWQYADYKRMASDFARAEKSLLRPKIKRDKSPAASQDR